MQNSESGFLVSVLDRFHDGVEGADSPVVSKLIS